MSIDYEAKAREFVASIGYPRGSFNPGGPDEHTLIALLRSVAAEARQDALEEAAAKCDELSVKFGTAYRRSGDDSDGCSEISAQFIAGRIRALAGRKEGT